MNAESLLEKEEKLSEYIRLFCVAGVANPFEDGVRLKGPLPLGGRSPALELLSSTTDC
jgi:hypothetical protein